MLDINFFQSLANYANKAWKGSFTKEEIRENAETYLSDFNYSNEHGECASSIRTLLKNLYEDIDNGVSEAVAFYNAIALQGEGWAVVVFPCSSCDYKEVVFFSKTELENIEKHKNREMLIQDAIPTKSPMVREYFVSRKCMCPKCWGKMWLAENLDEEE